MRSKKAQFFLVIILSGIAVVLGILVAKGGGTGNLTSNPGTTQRGAVPFPKTPSTC